MKKKFSIFFFMSLLGIFSIGESEIQAAVQPGFRKLLSNNSNYYLFSNESYDSYDSAVLQQYLYDGGIIINNSTVNRNILNDYFNIDESLMPIDNHYWTGIYFNGIKNVLLKFELGYYDASNYDIKDESVIAEDIYSEIKERVIMTTATRDNTIIFNDYIIKILYKTDTTTKMCTYEISSQIVDNYKTTTGNNVIGNYSVLTSVLVSPESSYCVNEYNATIAFNSNVNILSENIFNDASTYQNLSKEDTSTYIDSISCRASSDKHGTDFKFRCTYEIESLDDYSNISLKTKLNSLSLKDNGWWIFQKTYSMDASNSKELFIEWNYNGLI